MSNYTDVFVSGRAFQEEEVRNRRVVVIDVLRAASVIVTALDNGAKGVIPVEDMSEAGQIAQNLDASRYLLCGEKGGVKIEGYHLGNSPLEYKSEVVKDKTLILNTTNGSKAIAKCESANEIYVASFLNISAIVEKLKSSDESFILICSGYINRLSIEDLLCAGHILYDYYNGKLPVSATDGARVAFALYEQFGSDIPAMISGSNHAYRLEKIDYADDIAYCSQKDITKTIPVMKEGILVKHG